MQAQSSSQGINYDRIFANGSPHLIRLLIKTLHVVPIASNQQSGFSKEVSSPNGKSMGRFCGYTESVRSPDIPSAMPADSHFFQRAQGRAYSGLFYQHSQP